MNRFPMLSLAALAVLAPTVAGAADRTVAIGSFDRVRVSGPIEVRIATGRPAGARVSGDAAGAERVSVALNGSTLAIQPSGSEGWGERPRSAPQGPVVVTLTTPSLSSAISIAGAKIAVTRMKGARVDLSMSGSGAIVVDAVDAEQLSATTIGAGAIAVAGRAATARLTVNGPATIDAGALDASEVRVQLDGLGEVRAQARYTASVNNLGLGKVTVAGKPKCTVVARSGGPVVCGVPGDRAR